MLARAMVTVLALGVPGGADEDGAGYDLEEVGGRLRELAALAPEARRDVVAELLAAEGRVLLDGALDWAVEQDDPWTAGADAGVLAALLEALAGGIVATVGIGDAGGRRTKLLLSGWAQLLRAVEFDAAANRAEAHRRFQLAGQYGDSVGDGLCYALALLGAMVCGSAAHTVRADEIMPNLEPVIAELERILGLELPQLREGLWLRYEAFEVVAAATGVERLDEAAELSARWLEQRLPEAFVELAVAWKRELWRLLEDGEDDRAEVLGEWGDRLVAPADPGSPFRYWLLDFLNQAMVWDRVVRVAEPLRAEYPDDLDLLCGLAKAHENAGRQQTAIELLRTGLSDPPTAAQADVLRYFVVMLVQSGSPEADRREAELVRLTGTGVRDLVSSMPRSDPEPQQPYVWIEDGKMVVSPDIGRLTPGEIEAQINAVLIGADPNGAQKLLQLAEDRPLLAARVARLLGVPLVTRAHRESAAHLERGEQHFQRREFLEAAACYQQAVTADPDSALALLVLGDAYYALRLKALARAYYRESLAVEETPTAWRFLGDTYRSEHDGTERARECYRRALELDPGYGGARLALSQLPPPPAVPTTPGPSPSPATAAEATEATEATETAEAAATGRPAAEPTAWPAAGPGIEADLPAQLEESIRRQRPPLGALLDALTDDEAFARWLREDGPAHWSAGLWALKMLGHHWSARGTDPERARLIAHRCVQIAESLDGPWPDGDEEEMGRARLLAVTLEGLADVTTELGRHSEAYDLLKAAEQWLEADQEERTRAGKDLRAAYDQIDGSPPHAGLHRKLAAAARRSGDDAGAEHWSRVQREREGDTPVSDHDRMLAIVNRALNHFQDGDVEQALRQLAAAERIAENELVRSPVKVAMATVRHAFGQLHGWLGLPRTALEHLAAARALNAGNADRLAADWAATAAVFEQWPDLGYVVPAYEQVLVLSSVPGARRGERLFWAPRGEPTAATGRRIVAVERAWSIVLPMAQEAWRTGELYTATDVLTLGADLADLVRAAQPDPALRIRIQDERAHVHELLTRYRLERAVRQSADAAEHLEGAYLAAERKRARTLMDALSTARLRTPTDLPPELLEQEAGLLRARAEVEGAGRVDWNRHRALSEELDRLWERIAAVGPEAAEYTAIRRADVMAPADVRAELAGEDAVVASYALLDDGQVVLFALDAEHGLRVQYIEADGPRLLRFVEDHFGSAGQVRELAEDLPGLFQHELAPLVAPLAQAAAPGRTVLICPTGSLHHVPFHALAVPGHATLLDRNPVGYLPTVSLLRTLNRRTPGAGRGAVVLGDPGLDLPHARAEATALAARLGTVPLLGGAATREQVLRSAPGAAVLHAACHARFDAADPLASGLVLADGVLTARDILQQDWHSVRLAVLSACETGVGRTSRTDETLGLSRSLLFAGVRSLVMSLWRVPDRTTAALMGDFHDLTRAGTAPAPALRAAMLAARDRPGGDRLDRWAAFCLLGDWRAPSR